MIDFQVVDWVHHFYFPAHVFLNPFGCKLFRITGTYHQAIQDPKPFDQFDSTFPTSYPLSYHSSSTVPTLTQAGQISRICPLVLVSIKISMIYNDQTLFIAPRAALRVLFPGTIAPGFASWIVTSSDLYSWWLLHFVLHLDYLCQYSDVSLLGLCRF